MKKIRLLAILFSFWGVTLNAHEGHHGPVLSDGGKYGGLVAPVIAKSESELGDKATVIYKSELARSGDGTVRLYLYDPAMKPVALTSLSKGASAVLGSKVKGKWVASNFTLELKDHAFIGKMPSPKSKPYSIEITLKAGDKNLLTAFSNLD